MPDELAIIYRIAEQILADAPDPVVRFRLLRNVLGRPIADPEVVQAQKALLSSRWVAELEQEQWQDGSWGRFHSRDSKVRKRILTTEMGVSRALALGLEAHHPILDKAAHYIAGFLRGTNTDFRERAEKNDRWPTGVQLFTAATLALIQPDHPLLDAPWELWMKIAGRTFVSGEYEAEAEIQAHRELTGATVKDSYLVLNGKYQLILLSSRPTALPFRVEEALLTWIWRRRGGIGYVGIDLDAAPDGLRAGDLDRWVTSLELLSRFPHWRKQAQDAVQWLWKKQTPEGYWDFGPRASGSTVFPLSETWQRKGPRKQDWTARVIGILKGYYV